MKQTLFLVSLVLASVANAEIPETYPDALAAAYELAEQRNYDFFSDGPIGTYGTDILDRGLIDRKSSDGETFRYEIELVAVLDIRTRVCQWAHQTDIEPQLPRSSSKAVESYAYTNAWPIWSIAPIESEVLPCFERSVLAILIGNLDAMDVVQVGDKLLYIGFPQPLLIS